MTLRGHRFAGNPHSHPLQHVCLETLTPNRARQVTVTVERPGPGGIEQEITIKLTRKPPVAITSTLITDA